MHVATSIIPCALHFVCMDAVESRLLYCLNPCSKVIRQQNAVHSRQALLSAVHCDAGDTLLCGLCVFIC